MEHIGKQEMELEKQQMFEEMAQAFGAVYETDDAGNKTGVWLPADQFEYMMELIADAAAKFSELESFLEDEDDEDEEFEDEESYEDDFSDDDEDDLDDEDEDDEEDEEYEEESVRPSQSKR
jgi:hypothetical protein